MNRVIDAEAFTPVFGFHRAGDKIWKDDSFKQSQV